LKDIKINTPVFEEINIQVLGVYEDGMMDCLDRKPIEAVHLRQEALGAFQIWLLQGGICLDGQLVGMTA
jgi:hypothetical protein